MRIIGLLLRLLSIEPSLKENVDFHSPVTSPEKWRDWKHTYTQLLDQGRIWDFGDLLLDLLNHQAYYGSGHFDFTMTPFFTSNTPDEFCRRIHDDWVASTAAGEALNLTALVCIFSAIALNSTSRDEVKPLAHASLRFASSVSEVILARDPSLAGSLPLLLWLFAKICVSTSTGAAKRNAAVHDMHVAEPNLEAGMVWPRLASQATPVYIPFASENPGWMTLHMGTDLRNSVGTILGVAKGQENYRFQAACLCVLAMSSSNPRSILEELSDLRMNKQGDLYGYLVCCLSKYLVYKDDHSRQTLRTELAGLGNWAYPQGGNSTKVLFVAARDIILCALSPTQIQTRGSSIQAGLPYYNSLPTWLQARMRRDVELRSKGALTIIDGEVVPRNGQRSKTRVTRDWTVLAEDRGNRSTSRNQWDSQSPKPPPSPHLRHTSRGVLGQEKLDKNLDRREREVRIEKDGEKKAKPDLESGLPGEETRKLQQLLEHKKERLRSLEEEDRIAHIVRRELEGRLARRALPESFVKKPRERLHDNGVEQGGRSDHAVVDLRRSHRQAPNDKRALHSIAERGRLEPPAEETVDVPRRDIHNDTGHLPGTHGEPDDRASAQLLHEHRFAMSRPRARATPAQQMDRGQDSQGGQDGTTGLELEKRRQNFQILRRHTFDSAPNKPRAITGAEVQDATKVNSDHLVQGKSTYILFSQGSNCQKALSRGAQSLIE